jgi:hypothetical protein
LKKAIKIVVILWSTLSFAQEETLKPHHSVGLLIGHTQVRQGANEGNKKWLNLPSFALDYNYFFSEKWSAGLHNDIVIENFKVVDYDEEVIERSRPLASILTAGYKPGKHFTYQLGLGGEFAKEENLALLRIGAEYGLEISNDWEFIANLVYDLKWNAYDSFGLSVGISKSFGK